MTRNIPYTTGENAHARRVLDIYAPAGVDNYPLLMFVSGGGWTSGSKDWVANVGTTFAAQGIGVALVDHRLMPHVQYSDQVDDLAHAFAWLSDNIATWGGDPSRIVVGGHSAGGHLAALLAMDDRYLAAVGHSTDDVTGMILVSAALDVGDSFGDGETASPVNHVRAGLSPALLLFAEDDFPNMSAQAHTMQTALVALGVAAESAMIPGRDHFTIIQRIGTPDDAATQAMSDWLATVFK